jgi:inorganic pyrophosphatase
MAEVFEKYRLGDRPMLCLWHITCIINAGDDPKNGLTSVERILFPAMFYPCNYGFIPQTKEEQPGSNGAADPIDVFVLGNYSC